MSVEQARSGSSAPVGRNAWIGACDRRVRTCPRHAPCPATSSASTWERPTSRWRTPTPARRRPTPPAPIRALAIPQVVGVNDVARAAGPAVVPVPARGQGVSRRGDRPALEVARRPGRRRVRARPRREGAGPAGQLGQELALACGRRPPRRDPALDRRRGRGEVSPVEASAAYLDHLRDAWNHAGRRQDGRRPARAPGRVPDRPRLVRRRRPRADRRGRPRGRARSRSRCSRSRRPRSTPGSPRRATSWRKQVKVGDILLVCDVGGGTTDFTLIAVSEQGGDLALTRLAVGEHILLGGDNMDLALAHAVAATLPERHGRASTPRSASRWARLPHRQGDALRRASRRRRPRWPCSAAGSKVIGGAVKTELTRELLDQVLLDGFLPAARRPTSPRGAGGSA